MSATWLVSAKNDKTKKYEKFSATNIMDHKFCLLYINDLLNSDDTVLVEKIVFCLDDDIYSSNYILKILHTIFTKNANFLNNIEFEFVSKNQHMINSYEKIIKNMKNQLLKSFLF